MQFKMIKRALCAVQMLAVISCGSSSTAPTESTPAESIRVSTAQDDALSKEFTALPKGVLVRVPVDAQGKEATDTAEIRAIDDQVLTSTDAGKVWANGRISSELDKDSSTQAFAGDSKIPLRQLNDDNVRDHDNQDREFRDPDVHASFRQDGSWYGGYGGGYYGGGYYGGYYRGYRGGYQNNYYSNYYRPAWYSQVAYGSYWGYNSYPFCYNYAGYNYYYYGRPSCSVYSWCGY
jgi:hypothetical protein